MPIRHNKIFKFLSSVEDLIPDKSFIDYGCGDGFAASLLKDLGADTVYTYDPVAEPIFSPLERHFTKPMPLKVDIVFCHHVIEHVKNIGLFLKELKETGDELWLGCPNMENADYFSLGHINNFYITNLTASLIKAGFGTSEMKWWVNDGQLRIRVPMTGVSDWPKEMKDAFKRGKLNCKDFTRLNWR